MTTCDFNEFFVRIKESRDIHYIDEGEGPCDRE